MREDRSRWQQHSRAEGGQADGERDGAEEEEEQTVCSWSISPVLESSTETAEEDKALCHQREREMQATARSLTHRHFFCETLQIINLLHLNRTRAQSHGPLFDFSSTLTHSLARLLV